MLVAEAQREVRQVHLGGFVGQLVSGAIWLLSAALATWGSPRLGVVFLLAAGFFIYPLTQLGLRALGRSGRLSEGNPLAGLAMQIAFTLPMALPVVGAAALYRLNWFYPAFMVVLGAHYLPFTFLYGMRMFAALSGVLVLAGVLIGLYASSSFSLAAWVTGAVLIVSGFVGRRVALAEERAGASGQAAARREAR